MKKNVLFFCCSLVLFFSGCSDSSKEDLVENDVASSSSSFFLYTPSDWDTLPHEADDPGSVIITKREPSYSYEAATFLTVSVHKAKNYPLDQLVKRNLETVRKLSQDFQKISEEKISLSDGSPAIFVEYTERLSKTKAQFGFYNLYYLKEDTKELYVVTLVFDPTTSFDHKKFLKEDVLLSFYFPEKKEEE
jgi:hypothetical protein